MKLSYYDFQLICRATQSYCDNRVSFQVEALIFEVSHNVSK